MTSIIINYRSMIYLFCKNINLTYFARMIFSILSAVKFLTQEGQRDTFRVWRAIILLLRVKCFGPARVKNLPCLS